jgi:chromosome segregation ATPase
MATDKKHIAVYLNPAVEQALIAFCEQKGMVSKKGFMYSAGVNAVLAEFFGLSSAEPGNTPQKLRNIPSEWNNTPLSGSNILVADNIPTDTVTQEVTDTRISALEERVEVLQESLQESLKALWEALPGKSDGLSDSPELLRLEVTDTELQIELDNLKVESENLRQRLAESQDTIETLNLGTEALNEQLAVANQAIIERDEKIESLRQELTENTRYYAGRLNEAGATIGNFKDKLAAAQAKNQRLQNGLDSSQAQVAELREQLQKEPASPEKIETKLSDLKQKSATASELPEAAELYNQLKTRRKKSTASLTDIEVILEMIEKF